MTTITDIRNDLINVFNKLRDGTMEAKDAVEINNTAGKIIASAKVQLAYAALKGETPNIPFLQSSEPVSSVPALPAEERAPKHLDAPAPYTSRRVSGTRY
ncbi:hypothetical protein [Massilia sp. CT11-137]|uniref:hypothetical protein n=1 Tax=Massilia sp. CT11-137 TaxID=3393901 RepID=UPI0039AF382D